MRLYPWLQLLLLSLAACKHDRQQPLVKASARARVAPPPSTSAAKPIEQSVDLLHRTAAIVVTSSHADGNSTGAYLVDELTETSWQANPPDIAAWIEIDLPAPANIERFEITLAEKSKPSLDALSNVAGLLTLDPRGNWQPHPARRRIDAGDLILAPEDPTPIERLRFSLSGAPRGMRIAELRAIGRIASSEVLPPAIPETQFQGNPRIDYSAALFAAWVLGAPYATEQALCQAFTRAFTLAPTIERKPSELCRKLPEIAVSGAAPPSVRAIERYRLIIPDEYASDIETTALVAHTDGGLLPANLALTDTRNQAMCPGGSEADMQVGDFRFDHGVLLFDRTRFFSPGVLMMSTPGVAPPVAAASLLRCRIENRFTCREFITKFGTPTTSLNADGFPYIIKLPTTWDWSRTVTLTARGSVRMSPCRAGDARVVPCATPGAQVL